MRKERTIELQDQDQTLTFKVRQMPATQLQDWILRALLLVAGSGAQVPEGADIKAAGAFLAEKGLAALSNIDFAKARPLIIEMLGCCSRVIERVEERCTPESVDNYILDVTTLFRLEMEAFKLNLGFFVPEAESPSGSRGRRSSKTQ